jgi:hypothetical protein
VASRLGISRQRVNDIRRDARLCFPEPAFAPGGRALWWAADIDAYAATRNTRPGRPKAADPVLRIPAGTVRPGDKIRLYSEGTFSEPVAATLTEYPDGLRWSRPDIRAIGEQSRADDLRKLGMTEADARADLDAINAAIATAPKPCKHPPCPQGLVQRLQDRRSLLRTRMPLLSRLSYGPDRQPDGIRTRNRGHPGPVADPKGRHAMTLPRTDTAAALRLAGRRDEIHPADAMAFTYPDREYFEASAKRDRENNGNEVIGPFETDEGLIGIVSMQPQMRARGWEVTDPALPDDYGPGAVKSRAV